MRKSPRTVRAPGAWRLRATRRPSLAAINAPRAALEHRRLEDALLGDGVAIENRRDLAVPHHRDAVGDVDELGQVARIEQDGVALAGELAHQRKISPLVPTSTPRVGS